MTITFYEEISKLLFDGDRTHVVAVKSAFENLSQKYQFILYQQYGPNQKTGVKIAEDIGATKQHVYEMRHRALRKILNGVRKLEAKGL